MRSSSSVRAPRFVRAARALLRLPRPRRRVLARAAVVVPFMRASLWILPYRRWWGLVRMLTAWSRCRPLPGAVAEDVAWSVRQVSRLVPAATCLTRSAAAAVLLAPLDGATRLRFGVVRTGVGTIRAHAWLETATGVLLADGDLDSFHLLESAGAAPWRGRSACDPAPVSSFTSEVR